MNFSLFLILGRVAIFSRDIFEALSFDRFSEPMCPVGIDFYQGGMLIQN